MTICTLCDGFGIEDRYDAFNSYTATNCWKCKGFGKVLED